MDNRGFAVVIPVSPKPADVRRLPDLIDSLLRWEPGVAWCVLVDDATSDRHLTTSLATSPTCTSIALENPRKGKGYGHRGGIYTGMARAFSWILENAEADFVLKLDPDAFVIGPFSERVRTLIANDDSAGVIGAMGCSSNPDVRTLEDLNLQPELLRIHRLLPPEPEVDDGRMLERARGVGLPHISEETCRAFHAVRAHVAAAAAQGFANDENIQGGACVVTRSMLTRMNAFRFLANPEPWAGIPVGDDRILAMYAYAVGLRQVDCSAPGEPFGVQAIGLPYPPQLLRDLGYSLIHSIKSDRFYSEETVKRFFKANAA
jgi:hypothetical protein